MSFARARQSARIKRRAVQEKIMTEKKEKAKAAPVQVDDELPNDDAVRAWAEAANKRKLEAEHDDNAQEQVQVEEVKTSRVVAGGFTVTPLEMIRADRGMYYIICMYDI